MCIPVQHLQVQYNNIIKVLIVYRVIVIFFYREPQYNILYITRQHRQLVIIFYTVLWFRKSKLTIKSIMSF